METRITKLNRILVELPSDRVLSYSELLVPSRDEVQSSQDLETDSSNHYKEVWQNLMTRGDILGISSKYYRFTQNSSDSELSEESYDGSFVDKESDLSSANNDELELAIQEGFYAVPAKEITLGNELKRKRCDENSCEAEILERVNQISEIVKKQQKKYISNKTTELIMEIKDRVSDKENEAQEKVFKNLAATTGLPYNKIMSHMDTVKDKENKKAAYLEYKEQMQRLFKKIEEVCKADKKWNNSLEMLYEATLDKLQRFININNEILQKARKEAEMLCFNTEKDKIDLKIVEKGLNRNGIQSQPIIVESDTPSDMPKLGKMFFEISQIIPEDFKPSDVELNTSIL
jgi:hypothetical protein